MMYRDSTAIRAIRSLCFGLILLIALVSPVSLSKLTNPAHAFLNDRPFQKTHIEWVAEALKHESSLLRFITLGSLVHQPDAQLARPLIELLGDEEKHFLERNEAIWALGNNESPEATQWLIDCLNVEESSPHMRNSCLHALGQGAHLEAAPFIRQIATGGSAFSLKEQIKAVEILANSPSVENTDALISLLNEQSAVLTEQSPRLAKDLVDTAVTGLARHNSEESVNALVRLYDVEEKTLISEQAGGALVFIGHPSIVPSLKELIGKTSINWPGLNQIRFLASLALARAEGSDMLAQLAHEQRRVRDTTFDLLLKFNDIKPVPGFEAALKSLVETEYAFMVEEVQKEAPNEREIEASQTLALKAMEFLNEAFPDAAFSPFAQKASLSRLIPASRRDLFAGLEAQGLKSLGGANSDASIEVISGQHGLQSSFSEVRQAALHALSRIGSDKAIQEIETSLDAPNEEERSSAVMLLGSLQVKQTVPRLIKMANDPSPRVRSSVAMVLGVMGEAEAISTLNEMRAGDISEYVRDLADVSLSVLLTE